MTYQHPDKIDVYAAALQSDIDGDSAMTTKKIYGPWIKWHGGEWRRGGGV